MSSASANKMAVCRRFCFFTSNIIRNLSFSTSSSLSSRKWRKDQGLEPDPRSYGPLTNLPDYSFMDGRPVILSNRKMRQMEQQREICKRVVDLTMEMDVGLERYYQREDKKKREKEAILKSKLKPKGATLLKKEKQ